jgi:hypothetical protein
MCYMFVSVNEGLAADLHIGRVPLPGRYRDGCGGAFDLQGWCPELEPLLRVGVSENALELVRRHYHNFSPDLCLRQLYGNGRQTTFFTNSEDAASMTGTVDCYHRRACTGDGYAEVTKRVRRRTTRQLLLTIIIINGWSQRAICF